MHGKYRIRRKARKQTVINHRAGTKPVFLIWLKDEYYAAVEIILRRQMAGRTQQHAGMAIMPAGMHHAIIGGCPFGSACLGYRQRIHIGAKRDAARTVATLQYADNAGVSNAAMHFQPEGFQQICHTRRRAFLGKAQFRMAVKIPPPFGHLRNQLRVEDAGITHLASPFITSDLIISAAFSAIIMVGALVLPDTSVGMTEASTTRRPLIP